MARGCPNLRHVGAGGCVRLTDASVRVLAARAGGGLRVLDFSGCRRVSKVAGGRGWVANIRDRGRGPASKESNRKHSPVEKVEREGEVKNGEN